MKRLFIIIPILAFHWVSAQESPVDSWNRLEFQHPLLEHPIPLSLLDLDSAEIGKSGITYFNQHREFKDVYAPKTREGFSVNSERFVSLGDWKIWGAFSFSKFSEKGTGFTQMADPYRDNPYKIADSLGDADWKKQHYLLNARIITPELVPNMRAGMGVSYEVFNGARQVDPRPLDKLIHIELTPHVFYNYQDWTFGFNLYYQRFREDLSITLENVQRPKNIYKMLGLGAYLYNNPIVLSGGLSRLYNGNTYGAGLTLARQLGSGQHVQASIAYQDRREDAIDGTYSPFDAGRHQQAVWKGLLTYTNVRTTSQHLIRLMGRYTTADNTESIQVLDASTQQYKELYSAVMHRRDSYNLELDYSLLLLKDRSLPNWQFELTGDLAHFSATYPATSGLQEISNYRLGVQGKKYLPFGASRWTISAKSLYKGNLDNALQYIANPASTNYVANHILYPNHYYGITDYWSNKLGVEYTFAPFRGKRSQLYIQADYTHVMPLNEGTYYPEGLKNNYVRITLGLYN